MPAHQRDAQELPAPDVAFILKIQCQEWWMGIARHAIVCRRALIRCGTTSSCAVAWGMARVSRYQQGDPTNPRDFAGKISRLSVVCSMVAGALIFSEGEPN